MRSVVMRAHSLQMGPTYKDKLMERVRTFNRKHRKLKFLGMLYAMAVLLFYNIGLHFCRNVKRYTCFASIMFFFIAHTLYFKALPNS